MTCEPTRACELLVGLEDMTVLEVDEDDNVLRVVVESESTTVGCAGEVARFVVEFRRWAGCEPMRRVRRGRRVAVGGRPQGWGVAGSL